MHDCKHALYPNQVSPWRLISPRKLVTYTRQSGPRGRTKEKSCHERTGWWWWWWQWWWMKRVCPLAVSAAYLSPTPLYIALPLVFFLSLCGYHHTESRRGSMSALPLGGNLNHSCHTHASQPPTKLPKENPKVVNYFCLPPKKPTHIQRYKLHAFSFYQAPFQVVGSSWKAWRTRGRHPVLVPPSASRLHWGSAVTHAPLDAVYLSVWVILNTLADWTS